MKPKTTAGSIIAFFVVAVFAALGAAPIIRSLQVTDDAKIYGYTNFFQANKALMQAAWPEVGTINVNDGNAYLGLLSGDLQYEPVSTGDGLMALPVITLKSIDTNKLSDATIAYLREGDGTINLNDGNHYYGLLSGDLQFEQVTTDDGLMARPTITLKSITTNQISDATIDYLRGGDGSGAGTFWNGMLIADDDTPHAISVRKIGTAYVLDVSQDPGDPGLYPSAIPLVADDLTTHTITIRFISGSYTIDISQ